MRVAITGAGGRLGRALAAALEDAPFAPLGPILWRRPEYDLDSATPELVAGLIERDRPEVVVHTAAWTDVDGCARDPDLAMKRNSEPTHALAGACAERAIDLVVISTNEVFDGSWRNGDGFRPDDPTRPINPYGASKLAGEAAAREAYESLLGITIGPFQPAGRPRREPQLAIVRTSWLFGPPGNDFPAKILAAAQSAASRNEPLKAVGDEWGVPTYAHDLAEAIVELLGSGEFGGIHHIVNGLFATRADWARYMVARARLAVDVQDVPASSWQRASTPPRWGVLEPTPLPSGEPLRPWPDAMADYAPTLIRQWAASR